MKNDARRVRLCTLSVLAAGCLWGTMGFWRRGMEAMGLSTVDCLGIRVGVAALLYAITILIIEPSAFKIKLKDLWCFLGSGIVSLLFFGLCYFRAMQLMSLSTAAILLYTAPVFVILLSVPLFGERLSLLKLSAMAMAFLGCCLVCGLGGGEKITLPGLMLGLGSGFCYALYSIFSRFALNKGYSSLSITFYSSLFAFLGALAISGGKTYPAMFSSFHNVFFCVMTGFVSAYLAYMLYTYGLEGLENGRASIMASIEPVVATLVGVFVYGEALSLTGIAGIVLVLAAIVLLNIKRPERVKT